MADNIEHQDKGELVANCDWFFFIYVVCHISIILRSQIVTLNVLLPIIVCKCSAFSL